MKKFFALGLLVFAGTLALASADGTASGTLTINGKVFKLQYAYAWHAPSSFDEKKMNTIVMLSDVKLTPEVAMDDFEPAELAKAKKLNAIRLEFDSDGDVGSGVFFSGELEHGQFSGSGMHTFEKTLFTPAAIEGKATIDKPRDFFGTKYEYSVTFKAPVAKATK